MKKLILFLLFAPAVLAQNSKYDAVASGPKGPIPSATVAVCTQPANTTTQPCSPKAKLCSSATDTVCSSPNPLTADSSGNYHFYIKQTEPFTVQIYGEQLASPLVLPDRAPDLTITGAHNFTHAGVFNGSSYQGYLTSAVNGYYGSGLKNLDAVAGSVTIPPGATVPYNADGVAGYCLTNADTRSPKTGHLGHQSNCVGLFGIADANVSNSGAWGANTTTTDSAGTSNTFLMGYEADMWVQGTPYTVFGMQITLAGNGKMPVNNSYAINIEPSSMPHQGWTYGLESSDACCSQALQVGSATGEANSASQTIGFVRRDSQGRRRADGYIMLNSTGDLVLGTPAIGSVAIPGAILQPGVPYANLPASPVEGMQQFCTNCGPTNPASCSTNNPSSCRCRAGGGSMWAKYENFVNNGPGWYCH